MKLLLAPTASRLAPVLLAMAMTAFGCSGSGLEPDPSAPSPQTAGSDSAEPEPSAPVGLGTPFLLEARATPESLEQAAAEIVRSDGSRLPVAAKAISFELRSDGRVAVIDRVRVDLELVESAHPVAISNRASTALTVLDSSPDYVRATAGLAWSLEPEEPRGGPDGVPVSVSLEAVADGSHVRLTMRLESRAEFALGDLRVSTGPWVVQLEGDLMPR